MNSQHKEIRAVIMSMAPKRAIEYIESFDLPEEEQLFLVECDVRRKSHVKAAGDNHTSPEVIKRRKNSAYSHIADAINNQNPHK